MNSNRQTNKLVKFLQNNVALLIIILCVLAIASIIIVVALSNNNDIEQPVVGNTDVEESEPDDTDDDSGTTVVPDDEPTLVNVYFISPVEQYTIGMGYTDGQEVLFVFNQTLNSWTTRTAVSLIADEGSAVYSMHDGTVIEVSESYALGNTVVIDHGDNIIVTYTSLGNVTVVEGQVLSQGDSIGIVSTTANNEFMEGDHVSVSITVDGVNVDPTPYIEGTMYITQEVS